MMPPVYLDYNATTPIAPEVAAAMRPFLERGFGNPSSAHWYGREAAKAVVCARGQVAGLLGCSEQEIVFTSGGSESNNLAIKGVAGACRKDGCQIITTAIEHPAVIQVCQYLMAGGVDVCFLPVDRNGRLDPDSLKQALTDRTILVSVMHANNEVGTIQPIAELAAIAHEKGALFHSDAAQSVGKIPVRVHELGVDLLSLAGHKFYGPKGVGALFIRAGVELERLIHGADHEGGRRAGTENVLGLVGLGMAAEVAARGLQDNAKHMSAMRDRLEAGLQALASRPVRVHGKDGPRLPNTSSVGFDGVQAHRLVEALADRVAISAGAACHGVDVKISSVLQAMKVPAGLARGTVRLSTGRETSADDIDQAVRAIGELLDREGPIQSRS